MIFEITSFGDTATLRAVFNAIASIFADSVYQAGAYALTLFIFVVSMAGSLTDGKQELPIPRLLAAFFLYIAGFSTLSSVSIEDRYDGTVTTIDNIPIAISVPASLFSSIGYELTQLSETSFGSVNEFERISERGFLSPLKVIASYRKMAQMSCPLGQKSSVLGLSICETMQAYMRDCAMVKARRDGATQIMKDGDFLESIKFDSSAYTTTVFTSNGRIVEKTCKEAYSDLKSAYESSEFDSKLNSVAGALKLRPTDDVIQSTADVMAAIQADSGASRNFQITVMAMRAAEEGELAHYMKNGAADMAENLNSSIEKRNYEWTMQGEMWSQITNKFITIIEAILYAVTPFIGLMILAGSTGAKSLVLFMQMLGVIQLIPILLLVTQNIIINDLSTEIVALQQQSNTGSINFATHLLTLVQDKMALGGMISATVVPALAMALITGSGFAVMGAFRGAAVAPKDTDAVADTMGQGGSIQNLSQLNEGHRDVYGNTYTAGAEQRIGEIARSVSTSADISSAQSKLNAAQSTYTSAQGNLTQTMQSSMSSSQQVQTIGSNILSGSSTMNKFVENEVREMVASGKISQQEAAQMQNTLAAGLAVAGTGTQLNSAHLDGLSKEAQQAYKEATTGTKGQELATRWEEQESIAESRGESVSTSNTALDSQIEKTESAKNARDEAQEQYSMTLRASDTASMISKDTKSGIAFASKDENVQRTLADKIAQKQDDTNWRRVLDSYYAEFSGGENATKLDNDSALLAAFLATNNAVGSTLDNLEVLSEYQPNQVATSDDLGSRNFSPEDRTIGTPVIGDIQREAIDGLKKNSVEEVLNRGFIEGGKQELVRNNQTGSERVESTSDGYNHRFNEMKSEITSRNIKPHEQFQEVSKSIADFLKTDNIVELASGAYNMAMEEYYQTNLGKADIAATNFIKEKYENFSAVVSEFGQDSKQAIHAATELFDSAVIGVGKAFGFDMEDPKNQFDVVNDIPINIVESDHSVGEGKTSTTTQNTAQSVNSAEISGVNHNSEPLENSRYESDTTYSPEQPKYENDDLNSAYNTEQSVNGSEISDINHNSEPLENSRNESDITYNLEQPSNSNEELNSTLNIDHSTVESGIKESSNNSE